MVRCQITVLSHFLIQHWLIIDCSIKNQKESLKYFFSGLVQISLRKIAIWIQISDVVANRNIDLAVMFDCADSLWNRGVPVKSPCMTTWGTYDSLRIYTNTVWQLHRIAHDSINCTRTESRCHEQDAMSLFVAICVARLSRLTDKIIWPHILPQTDSILGDIVGKNNQFTGSVTHGIYCLPL